MESVSVIGPCLLHSPHPLAPHRNPGAELLSYLHEPRPHPLSPRPAYTTGISRVAPSAPYRFYPLSTANPIAPRIMSLAPPPLFPPFPPTLFIRFAFSNITTTAQPPRIPSTYPTHFLPRAAPRTRTTYYFLSLSLSPSPSLFPPQLPKFPFPRKKKITPKNIRCIIPPPAPASASQPTNQT